MPFVVPQFIEKEARIVGPFTFKQFIFIGAACALALFLYFIIKSFILFLFIAFFLIGGGLVLALFKTSGFPLPIVIQRAFVFLGRPKIYLWQKKVILPKIVKKKVTRAKTEDIKKGSSLKISEGSHLRSLQTILEIKSK